MQLRMVQFVLTFVANRSDVNDSFRCAASGERFKIIFAIRRS